MEFHGASGTPWVPTLSLENYLHLEKLDVISASILRKIINMHGFKSFKVPKSDLIGAVRSIDLMDAQHSTLQSDVSSNAFLSLNDVIKDLSVLHWQECCITALETINCVTDFSSVVDEASSRCSKSVCDTASISRNDSVGHKTQSQELMKFAVTGKRSAEPYKPNFDKIYTPVFSSKVDSGGHKTQSQTFDERNISAKYVKPNFNTVFSSQEDSEGQNAQSQALSIIAVSGKTSAKPVKPNFNTVFSSNEDSEIFKRQSQALELSKENRLAPYFNTPFRSEEDSGGVTDFSSVVDEASSKCSKSECSTASISMNDSVDHKTQSQTLTKFTVKARPLKRNFNTASSCTGNPEGYTTQFQPLDKIKGHTSAKYVKPNFNTVFSSKDDSEGHKAQSHALNTIAITEKRSAEPYKPNFDKIYTPVFSSKVDSEGHKTQSQTLNERNISAKYGKSNFNMIFSSQEDSEGHKAQSHALSIIAVSGKTSAKPVKPNFNTVFSSREDSEIFKTQSQALDLSADKENRLAPNFNTSFCSKEDSGGHRTQFQLFEKIDGNTSSARFGKKVYHRSRKGIKKPSWMNEYARRTSKASYQI